MALCCGFDVLLSLQTSWDVFSILQRGVLVVCVGLCEHHRALYIRMPVCFLIRTPFRESERSHNIPHPHISHHLSSVMRVLMFGTSAEGADQNCCCGHVVVHAKTGFVLLPPSLAPCTPISHHTVPSLLSLRLSGMTPGEVLVRFLAFFGRQFDASRVGISVGRGALNNPFALSPSVDPRTGMPVMDAHVVIEDPLDRDQNVARSCFGFPQVRRRRRRTVRGGEGDNRAFLFRPCQSFEWFF